MTVNSETVKDVRHMGVADLDQDCLSILTDCDLALRDAALHGNIGVFSILLKTGANIAAVDIPLVKTFALTRFAWITRSYALIDKSLLENPDPTTALVSAVKSRDAKMVATLLSAGADVNAACPQGIPPLDEAILQRNIQLIEILLASGADVNKNRTLTAAKLHGCDVVSILLNAGACINIQGLIDKRSRTGRLLRRKSPLQQVVARSKTDLVRSLIDRGADVNAPGSGEREMNALQLAVDRRDISMLRILLEAGARDSHPSTTDCG
ncbi:ankyrin repeat-containing domain protein [Aspergillus bertholletiae]|uniref:Ankyrin repeat-containing domain protein n=1 Tax=Aspergillus bertholletiae TaxID=1226010 RepID=A0A5N7B9R9_9EURO|nr:ankyrin repeat-containing domain protein [Aspergillus bertholletiae]